MLSLIRNTSFYKKIESFCKKFNLFNGVNAVCVAFSGGADSTALLAVMRVLCDEMHLELAAHHVRHGLRESDHVDAEMSRKTAQLLDVRYMQTELRLDHAASNVEAVARNARMAALIAGIDSELRATTALATAHHADENVETLFWRLGRGCGLEGASLAARSFQDVVRIRPLLAVGKDEIYAFLREIGLTWAEDPTNSEDKYRRNRIRHHVLQAFYDEFSTKQPIYDSLLRLGCDAAALSGFAESFVRSRVYEGRWFCTKEDFGALCVEAQKQVLRHVCRHCVAGYVPDSAFIERVFGMFWARREGLKHVTNGTIDFSWNRRGFMASSCHAMDVSFPKIELEPCSENVDVWGFGRISCFQMQPQAALKNTETRLCFVAQNSHLSVVSANKISVMRVSDGREVRVIDLLKKMGAPEVFWENWPVLVNDSGPLWILSGPRSDLAVPAQIGMLAYLVSAEIFCLKSS